MLLFLPVTKLIVKEICTRHQRNTDHVLQFNGYNAKLRIVFLEWYCEKCDQEIGKFCFHHKKKIDAEDWLYMIAEVNNDASKDN